MPPNLPLNALRTFEAAARHRQFLRAAEELSVTHGAVSKQIRLLEEHLGVQLFLRRGRSLALTPEGQRLSDDLSPIFQRLWQSVHGIELQARSGSVRITVSPAFSNDWLCPRLGELIDKCPDLQIHIFPLRIGEDLPVGKDWVAVQFVSDRAPSEDALLLERARYIVVASPQLVYGDRPINRPSDLLNARLLHEDEGARWRSWFVAQDLDWVPSAAPIVIPLATQLLAAARAGVGVAIMNATTVEEELRTGRLVAPFGGFMETDDAYYLMGPPEDLRSPEAQIVYQWISGKFGSKTQLRD